jgi:hypothetical protein
MPSLTPKQHRAMKAAASGHSTLGIPRSVGQDFVTADAARAKFARTRPTAQHAQKLAQALQRR